MASVRTAHLCSTWGELGLLVCLPSVGRADFEAGLVLDDPHPSWASDRMSEMAGPLLLRGLSLFFSLSTGPLIFREASPSLLQGAEVQERDSSSKVSLSRGLEITQNHICHLLLVKASHKAHPDSGSGRNRLHYFMEGAVKTL